ncbi:MAG TPA: hypothetical protein DCM87_14280 [Planctomycetes bacterium]|jgi:hypothetical protein|nr:hypothetical protein [Planctomycetota bacterium]
MTTLTCKIPEPLDAALETFARRRRLSKSAVVREALELRLGKPDARHAPVAFALVKHLCGSIRGPSDLSTNPSHMEGFGG